MRLHAPNHDDAVRLERVAVAEDVHARLRSSQRHDVHRRANLAADGILGDAVAAQNFTLALARGSAV
jgi:hypothetical protein